MTTTEENKQKPPTTPPAWVNKMMIWTLRSPFHGALSKTIMVVEITGRKSGKTYTLPVNYYLQDDGVILCSSDKNVRTWWKNLRGGADVVLTYRGKEVMARADVVADDLEAIRAYITSILTAAPQDAKYYHVGLDEEKRPLAQDIAHAANQRVIVKFNILAS